jgi:hypothetical protein
MSEPWQSVSRAPRERDAARILERVVERRVCAVARFPTGLAHYVYDAVTVDGQRYAVRLARADQGQVR